jgi:hypothetical protein
MGGVRFEETSPVRLFAADATRDASADIASPYFIHENA